MEIEKKMIDGLMTFAEYASHKGVSGAAVSKAIKAGRLKDAIVMVRNRRYIDPALADEEWQKHTNPQEQFGKKDSPKKKTPKKNKLTEGYKDLGTPPDMTTSKEAEAYYNAVISRIKAKTMEVEFFGKIEKLMHKDDVEAIAFNLTASVKQELSYLPKRMALEVASKFGSKIDREGIMDLEEGFKRLVTSVLENLSKI